MSIVDWIEETFEAGCSSRIGQFLDVAYNIEYGAESAEQSALNLLYLLGYRGQGQFRLFGASDEKYHVAGGNDQITDRLADRARRARSRPAPSSSRSSATRRHVHARRSRRARRRRTSPPTRSCSRSRSRSSAPPVDISRRASSR